jgi:uncharacterized protein YukE
VGAAAGAGAWATRPRSWPGRSATPPTQINDAREQARRTARDTARDISDSQRDLAAAEESSARRIADAKREQVRANRDSQRQIADAQEREQDSLDALGDARERAGEQLDDLREKVASYALGEEGAQLRVQKALAAQRKTNRDVHSTYLERQDAAYDVKVAEAALASTQKDRAKDTAKLAKEEAKGVEGSDLVVAAKDRVKDASEAVALAEESAAERRADSARSVADAEREGADQIRAAQESLDRTREASAERMADANAAVADAVQRLDDVYAQSQQAAGGAAGGVDKFADAMKKLSPEAQQLVRAILALKPAWEDMAHSIQDRALDGFAEKVTALAGVYIPLLKDGLGNIADGLNEMGLYAADALMAPETVSAVNGLLDSHGGGGARGSRRAGRLPGRVPADGRRRLGVPADDRGVDRGHRRRVPGVGGVRGRPPADPGLDRGRGGGVLRAVGHRHQRVRRAHGDLLGLAGEGGGGADFLQMVADMTQSLSDFVNSDGVQGILGFLGELARMIFDNIGVVAALWAGFQILSGVMSFAMGVLSIYTALQTAGITVTGLMTAATWLLNTALAVLTSPITLVIVAIGLLVAAVIYAYNHFDWFRNFVDTVWQNIKDAFAYGVGFAKGLLEQLVNTWHWLADGISGIAGWIGDRLSGMWEPMQTGARRVINVAIGMLNGLIRGINFAIRGMNALGAGLPEFGTISYLAKGGVAGGLAVVGEQGPELVRLPQGSTVIPHGQSKRMAEDMGADGQGSGGPVQIELTAGKGANGAVATMIMSLIRSGDLQLRQVA